MVVIYHPLRLLEGDDALAAEFMIQPSATSAASSLALFKFLPSYQNRAARICPLIVTRLDHAVRPPVLRFSRQLLSLLYFRSNAVGEGAGAGLCP